MISYETVYLFDEDELIMSVLKVWLSCLLFQILLQDCKHVHFDSGVTIKLVDLR